MASRVLVGFAVTSHIRGVLTKAEFSEVAVAGDMTEPWQVETIGGDQPGNDPAPIYLTLADSSGNAVTVAYPDPQATILDRWQEWLIPFDDVISGGVDVGMIDRICIGIGDPDRSTPAGKGMIFIDDIKVGHPRNPQ
jgi:hypothetical protein